LPRPPVTVDVDVLILQHPNEAARAIRTARIAELGLADQRCRTVVGRKFPAHSPALAEVLASEGVFLLWPGADAQPASVLASCPRPATLVALDGTWDEARKLFNRNPALQALKRIQVEAEEVSEYVVRTQPKKGCVSTLEAVALALREAGELDESQHEALLAPLRALCNFQINFGQVHHDSKEFKSQNRAFVKKNNFKQKK